MKSNAKMCHHLIMNRNESFDFQLVCSAIASNCKKMLGVAINYKLIFDKQVKTLCSKAKSKLRSLARTTPYMSVEIKEILMKSFFND